MSSEKFRFIREVAIRYVGQRRCPPHCMNRPEQVAAYLRRRVQDDAREHLVAIYLDARHRPIGDAIVSIGTANSTSAHPREVFQMAVALGACAVVLAHYVSRHIMRVMCPTPICFLSEDHVSLARS